MTMLFDYSYKLRFRYITVQCHSALLAHARPTMFYIPLVISLLNVIIMQESMYSLLLIDKHYNVILAV